MSPQIELDFGSVLRRPDLYSTAKLRCAFFNSEARVSAVMFSDALRIATSLANSGSRAGGLYHHDCVHQSRYKHTSLLKRRFNTAPNQKHVGGNIAEHRNCSSGNGDLGPILDRTSQAKKRTKPPPRSRPLQTRSLPESTIEAIK